MVPSTASKHRRQMMTEASRCPKRNAAQTSNGVHKKVQGSLRIWAWKKGPKMIPAVRSVEQNKAPASKYWRLDHFTRGRSVQRSRKGVKTRAPAASPSHQVRQIRP